MSDFPSSLPGIDVPSGLARVAGNRALFLKLLCQIANDAPLYLGKLNAATAEGNAPAAREIAHALKGAAGNLSIHDVASAAALVEQSAKAAEFTALAAHLGALEKSLKEYCKVVESLAGP